MLHRMYIYNNVFNLSWAAVVAQKVRAFTLACGRLVVQITARTDLSPKNRE